MFVRRRWLSPVFHSPLSLSPFCDFPSIPPFPLRPFLPSRTSLLIRNLCSAPPDTPCRLDSPFSNPHPAFSLFYRSALTRPSHVFSHIHPRRRARWSRRAPSRTPAHPRRYRHCGCSGRLPCPPRASGWRSLPPCPCRSPLSRRACPHRLRTPLPACGPPASARPASRSPPPAPSSPASSSRFGCRRPCAQGPSTRARARAAPSATTCAPPGSSRAASGTSRPAPSRTGPRRSRP